MSASTPKVLWVTDPWDTLDHANDTTLRLIEAFQARGAENFWCDSQGFSLQQRTLKIDAQRIQLKEGSNRTSRGFSRKSQVFYIKQGEKSPLDQIHYRVDPPVDLGYWLPLELLCFALGDQSASVIVNPPDVLFQKGEKMESLVFGRHTPESIISSSQKELWNFLKWHKRAVLKPLYQAQSKGVELLEIFTVEKETLARRTLEVTSNGYQLPVLLQEYLPQISEGETRLWFLDARLLACARKLPAKDDFRVQIDQGSRVVAHELTPIEEEIASEIAAHLESLKIRMAAIDLIGDKVTDFNFTSPGLISQLEKVTGQPLADRIAEALLPGTKSRAKPKAPRKR